jgi:uncharacterized protein (TIGR03118 family)
MHRFARVSMMIASLVASASLTAFAEDGVEESKGGDGFLVTPLVSDTGAGTAFKDPNLINGWGLVFNPTGPVWLANNGSGTSTLYTGTGSPIPLVVTIPAAPSSGSVPGSPTGIVYNGSTEFVVSKTVTATGGGTSTASGAAKFLYASEDGVITGWAPAVDLLAAVIAVDRSASHAVYKGLAIAGNGGTFQLYATDFHNRRVDVFDGSFTTVVVAGAFEDPALPPNYAPFGIQNIGGDLYVTYAEQDAALHDEVAGRGKGFVDVYDANGVLIERLAAHGPLDAPWGLALAPPSFGRFGGALLVGNFGNGAINAYDPVSRRHLGRLRDRDGQAIEIGGLWGLGFGNGVDQQPAGTLFYAAGPGGEQHGAYGAITPIP